MGRFQFSIRCLLAATAVVAAAVAAVHAEPSWQSCLAMEILTLFCASVAIVAASNSSGSVRVFWATTGTPLGFVAAIYLVQISLAAGAMAEIDERVLLQIVAGGQRAILPMLWFISLANGALCCLTYWLVRSRPPSENQISK